MKPKHEDIIRLADHLEGACQTIAVACGFLDLDEGYDWEDQCLEDEE